MTRQFQQAKANILSLVLTTAVLISYLLLNSAVALDFNKPLRIGVLTASWGPPPAVAGLIEGLEKLGYHEYDDFVIGVRFTQGDVIALPDAANELVRDGVDILFPIGEVVAQAAQQATTTHPIIFTQVGNPVGLSLINSFAQPGGNITGIADLDLELDAKRLQLFKELIPGLEQVLFPYSKHNEYQLNKLTTLREAAKRLNIELIERKVGSITEAQEIIGAYNKDGIVGILAPSSADLNIPGFVIETATKKGIPAMFGLGFYLEFGGLASYGSSGHSSGRQLARLLDKIIKGENPGDIPVEVDQYFEFVINLGVAKKLGIEIPPEVLFQADRIIE